MPHTPPAPVAITLIEHDEREAAGVSSALRRWRYGFQAAGSVAEGLRLMGRTPTPIVISDLHAPGPNGSGKPGGLELAAQVKRRWPNATVMLLAGDEDAEAVPSCIAAGADRLLRKPVAWPDLRFALDSSFAVIDLRQEKRKREEEKKRQQTPRPSEQLRTRLAEAVASLFITLEFRDPITHSHSRRVKRYALLLARHLGLERKHAKEVGLAAKLHDIGKIAIDENILRKPSDLTAEEIRAIQAHPAIGENIVRPIIRTPHVLAAIRGHHERMDGRGYPDGLAGLAIPLEARLLSVVDCFDALTSCRPYREQPMKALEAIDLLHRQTDGHLDPALVAAFQRVIEANPLQIQEIQELA